VAGAAPAPTRYVTPVLCW